MVYRVALVALDAAIVEGKYDLVVATDFTDVRLGQAHVTATYVYVKCLEDALQEIGQDARFHLYEIANGVELIGLGQVPASAQLLVNELLLNGHFAGGQVVTHMNEILAQFLNGAQFFEKYE